MNTLLKLSALTALAAGISLASPVLAQSDELSEQQIMERFNKQVEGLGATRGLTLSNNGTGGDGDAAQVMPDGMRIVEPENQVNLRITFEFDSAAIASDQQPKLERMCSAMKNTDIATFRIIGHTDAAGTEEYNEHLSKLRADEVKRYLTSAECGIEATRLEAIGVGEKYLFDTADPDADVNRRVEFQAMS
jgi:OmpA-OmpF porin, OOP family